MQFHLEGPHAVAALCLAILIIGFSIYGMVHYVQHTVGF